MDWLYPFGPIDIYIKQLSNLQRFKEARRDRFGELTSREMEILSLVAGGMKTSQVAEYLEISRVTVQNHRASIRDKLGINNQSEYIKYALAFGLIQF